MVTRVLKQQQQRTPNFIFIVTFTKTSEVEQSLVESLRQLEECKRTVTNAIVYTRLDITIDELQGVGNHSLCAVDAIKVSGDTTLEETETLCLPQCSMLCFTHQFYLLQFKWEQLPSKIMLQHVEGADSLNRVIFFCLTHGVQHLFVKHCIMDESIDWSVVEQNNHELEQNGKYLYLYFLQKHSMQVNSVPYMYPKIHVVFAATLDRFCTNGVDPFFG